MPQSTGMPFSRQRTGEVELDLGRYELRRFGRRVKLEKKPMELLIFLVGRREQLVSRADIAAKLWRSDLFIDTERNLNNIVRKLRTALRDNSTKPRFVETVVGKGYRFIGPVRVIDAEYTPFFPHHRAARTIGLGHANEWAERSSLAVLPLLLVGKGTDDNGLCLGFADALVSRLGNPQGVDVLPTSAVMNVSLEATAQRSLHAWAFALWFTAQSRCRRDSGVFRWRCSTPTCRMPASPPSATLT
jgi:DNA-binding winged helix-turn-helix (wHTH) protein